MASPFFSSCTHLSPLSQRPAPYPRFPVPEALAPQWRPLAAGYCPGLDYFEARVAEPRLEIRALRVDLMEPGLRIVVNAGEEGAGKGPAGIIPSIKVSSFVRRYGCAVGINANPFRPVSGKEGEDRTIVGIAAADGVPAALPAPPYDALVFYTNRRAAILAQAEIDPALLGRKITHAVGGFFRVLEAGEVPGAVLREGAPRHPRSAAGLSADGAVLYLLVIDGRRPGSIGATEGEIGILLKRLGAWEGLNFDGGGSSALALRFPDGKVRTVNTPIHNGIPGRERGVAACLGIAPLLPAAGP
ncbi:MAG: phosphodiester glycosidase family protein [Treponema sp.]|nr:phosphodiester glycosidase family protein [Treponema sp.]